MVASVLYFCNNRHPLSHQQSLVRDQLKIKLNLPSHPFCAAPCFLCHLETSCGSSLCFLFYLSPYLRLKCSCLMWLPCVHSLKRAPDYGTERNIAIKRSCYIVPTILTVRHLHQNWCLNERIFMMSILWKGAIFCEYISMKYATNMYVEVFVT